MECKNEASDGCKKDCPLRHGKGVLSFYKVMFDKSFLQILFFPPKFARSVSHLTDKETYLEDSSGQRWRVTVCNHHGSLSIRQGWPKFSSDHGLDVGHLLIFYYVPCQHFIVQIFGKSACEMKKFCNDIGNGRKRARTYPKVTIPSKLFQTTDINSVKKKSKTSNELESEKVSYKPNITDFATNVDAKTGKGQSVHSAINVDESFCMIDRNSQYDQEDDRLCLDLSSFEMPTSRPLAEGTSSPLKGDIEKDNHVETNLRSQEEPNLNAEIGNLDSEALLSKLEVGITATNMVSRPVEDIPLPGPKYMKSNKASQFDSGGEYTGDTSSRNAVYSCLLDIDGRDFLELPDSSRNHLLKRSKKERIIIYLQGPDRRIWPTFYHCISGLNVFTSGWKQVTATYGMNPGDGCLFQLVDKQKRIFDIRKIRKSKSKIPKNYLELFTLSTYERNEKK